MNLQKLFNYKFLLQNLKKSKAILAVFLGLIPILNVLVLLIGGAINKNGYIINMQELSVINSIGLYFIPVILSICLFDYVFKKKSVDFVGSLPIDRKTLFITNTLGGIIIIIGIMLINILTALIIGAIFSSLFIPFKLLIDYFIMWTVSYIFVFMAANLAMSISGNLLTQIITTALVVFFVPFITDYSTTGLTGSYYHTDTEITCLKEECKPEKYYCYGDKYCAINRDLGIYRVYVDPVNKNNNFTTPYALFYNMYSPSYSVSYNYNDYVSMPYTSYSSEGNIYNSASVIKMIFLSIIYFALGLLLFIRRKMEVCETSFKNDHAHSIVKSLTMVPILIVVIEIFREAEPIVNIIAMAIAIAYYLIYDLITRKGFVKLSIEIAYFLVISTFMLAFTEVIHYKNDHRSININVSDIKSLSHNGVTYKDKDIINLVMKNALSHDEDYDKIIHYTSFIINTKGSNEYIMNVNFTQEEYKKYIDLIMVSNEFIKYNDKYNYDKVFAIRIGDFIVDSSKYANLINVIKDETSSPEYRKNALMQKNYNMSDIIELYTYENHNYRVNNIYINLIPDLLKSIAAFHNDVTHEMLISSDNNEMMYVNLYNSDIEFPYGYWDYLNGSRFSRIKKFASETTQIPFNDKDDYFVLSFWMDSMNYYVYSNEIEKFKEVIADIKDIRDEYPEDYPYYKD